MRLRNRIFLVVAALLLLTPVALVLTLLYTTSGLALVVQQLPRLERYGLHFDAVSGTLAGTLRVGRFELDHPRVHIVSHDIVLTPQLRGLLIQTLQAGSLSARDTVVELREDPRPPSATPLRFLPMFLRVKVHTATLSKVRYVHTLTPRQILAPTFRVDGDLFDASGDLKLQARRPMDIELRAAGHLRLPNNPELTLTAQLGGDIDTLTIKAQVSAPSVANADVVLTHPQLHWQIKGRVDSPALFIGVVRKSGFECARRSRSGRRRRCARDSGIRQQRSADERAWLVRQPHHAYRNFRHHVSRCTRTAVHAGQCTVRWRRTDTGSHGTLDPPAVAAARKGRRAQLQWRSRIARADAV
jgi:hypothetical protein